MPCLALTAAQYKQHADCTLKSAHTPCTKFIRTCSSANAMHAWPCCAKMSYCLPCLGARRAPKLCAADTAGMHREARQRLSSAHAPIKRLPFALTLELQPACDARALANVVVLRIRLPKIPGRPSPLRELLRLYSGLRTANCPAQESCKACWEALELQLARRASLWNRFHGGLQPRLIAKASSDCTRKASMVSSLLHSSADKRRW